MDRVNTRNNEPNREKNLHFLACNFVTSIDKLFSAFPSNTLQLLSIQVSFILLSLLLLIFLFLILIVIIVIICI